MKLSEMRELLAREDIQLTKSLGQNFLHDGNQLRRIIEVAELSPADKVLEIGPGLGPLTDLLLKNAGEVMAIEKDGRLVQVLRQRFCAEAENSGSRPREEADSSEPLTNPPTYVGGCGSAVLRLLHDDALEFLNREPRDWRDWKLVANLPYSVASPILVELAAGARAPKKIVATLQLEVARRLMAAADEDDYGILTLLVQLDFAPQELFKIPPGSFFPEPEVDSACVVLNRRDQPLLPEELRPVFAKIVKRAFSQRRKMMMKLLKADWSPERLTQAFAALNISPQERAEKLSLEQFVKLTELLNQA